MSWENLGPSHFRPVDEGPDYFFVPVSLLLAALARMGAQLEQHGDAFLLIVDDRSCRDPIYLPRPTRGFYGYPSVEKICRDSPISVLDLCMEMRKIVDEQGAKAAGVAQPSAEQPRGRDASA